MSHSYWVEGLRRAFPEYQWQCLTLPPRHFNWRIRGAPLSWLSEQPLLLDQRYDLIVVTSMVDLATLKGLVPAISRTPCLYYSHENQFEYPKSVRQHASVDAQMVNLYAALAADRVLFNSAYNRDSFLAGVNRLLAKLPDHRPASIEPLLAARCQVLPVPLDAQPDSASLRPQWNHRWQSGTHITPIKIVWAARWEYDKAPDRLLAVVRELERRGTDYRLCVLGEQFRQVPSEFDTIKQAFGHRLVQFGYVESKQDYLGWLATADVVLSTSIHEFQGIAVLEAIAAGCVPVLPDRLAYPELVPPEFLYASYIDDVQQEAMAAVDLIDQHHRQNTAAPSVHHLTWTVLKTRYAKAFSRTIEVQRQ